ncbi:MULTISPECIES: hemolysin family protein [Nitratireductor]|uniref:hemolysin family protein n=1 Tax=Nitratireductor TaxID=245876 RepID=UPI000D0E0D38|nr:MULTISPECIES: hemolysin family protein [Nitratireductor]PSM16866.1 magnesium/cobalt efflux protein [Nitratireductor sp. StC3]
MNQREQAVAAPEAGDDAGSGEPPEESSSTEAPPQNGGRGLVQRFVSLIRGRNGSTLREDLADALAEDQHDSAPFSPGERAMLHNILRLREVRVEDVMVPRADIEAVELSTTLGELLKLFEESGHSRMPVYADSLDDPRGMVHIRDAVTQLTRSARPKKPRGAKRVAAKTADLDLGQVDLSRTIGDLSLTRPVLFVPPSMLASDLMNRMRAARTQMALVIDEYGGTDGLVSLEDIVEMVVGDIEDEHDDEEPMITKAGDGVFVVDARAEIDDVAEAIGDGFAAEDHSEDVDTIGGIIFNTLGRVPARGEVVQAVPGFEFHVLDADPRRVKRVRIVQLRVPGRRVRSLREHPADEA